VLPFALALTISLHPTVSAEGTEIDPAPELPRGARVGRYIVLERIGEGAPSPPSSAVTIPSSISAAPPGDPLL
jgi:hypothetical protein